MKEVVMAKEMIQHVVLEANSREEHALMEQSINVPRKRPKEQLHVKSQEQLYQSAVRFS